MNPKLNPPQIQAENETAFFLSAPEISVFVSCCVLINELHGLERSLQAGDISPACSQAKASSLLTRLRAAVEATQRFDVVCPIIESDHFSPFFWRWFNWWDDYLKGLTPSQVAEAERRARERGTLMEDLRPQGHWLAYRNDPAIALEAR